jgi:hypothetical protein
MFESNAARLIFLIGGTVIFATTLYLVIENWELLQTLIDELLRSRVIMM